MQAAVVLALVFGIAILFAFRHWLPGGGLFVGAVCGGLILLGVAYVAAWIFWTRWKNRHTTRAIRLMQAGDTAGATWLLRERLQVEGPTLDILNSLAVAECQEKHWDKALETIAEAESLGLGLPPHLKGNKGLALWKVGRREEAAVLLREVYTLCPHETVFACNYGMLLLEMGDIDGAQSVLEQTEKRLKGTFIVGREARRATARIVEEFRRAVAEVWE